MLKVPDICLPEPQYHGSLFTLQESFPQSLVNLVQINGGGELHHIH